MIKVLFVTDLAARGIDIPLLENVVHYDFPIKMKLFIHRSGRTARAGQSGTSYSIITPDELGYMHDLSIFVGRRHFDRVEKPGDSLEELVKDPSKICFGTVPQPFIDDYNHQVATTSGDHATLLDPLKKSIKLAQGKYNKTKDPASKNSISIMHSLTSTRPVAIHPALCQEVDPREQALVDFKAQLSKYKPK